jgi:hypothetical protein
LLDAKLEQPAKTIKELLKSQRRQNSQWIKIDEPKQIVESEERPPRR